MGFFTRIFGNKDINDTHITEDQPETMNPQHPYAQTSESTDPTDLYISNAQTRDPLEVIYGTRTDTADPTELYVSNAQTRDPLEVIFGHKKDSTGTPSRKWNIWNIFVPAQQDHDYSRKPSSNQGYQGQTNQEASSSSEVGEEFF